MTPEDKKELEDAKKACKKAGFELYAYTPSSQLHKTIKVSNDDLKRLFAPVDEDNVKKVAEMFKKAIKENK